MEYFNEPGFQDPADWDIASYTAHPIDSIEPLPDHSTSYRDAALECMKILRSVDVFMSRATDPRLAWTTVSHTIGLASTHGLSETQIAHQLGVSEHRLHRAMNKFTRLANLDPAGGLGPLGSKRRDYPQRKRPDPHCREKIGLVFSNRVDRVGIILRPGNPLRYLAGMSFVENRRQPDVPVP
ncbi:MAG TPA: hypothetical protein VIH54_15830 [Chthoniobacterales bacterium]